MGGRSVGGEVVALTLRTPAMISNTDPATERGPAQSPARVNQVRMVEPHTEAVNVPCTP